MSITEKHFKETLKPREIDAIKYQGQIELLERLKYIPIEAYSVKKWGTPKQYFISIGFINQMIKNIQQSIDND